ncbi:MAG: DUF1559 domain-containing protein [Candidatus Omnitrophica bacterium]|nr:DUF1559 domain-containing protein [Candidatus Omnitrophota bacterium]MCM8803522.1 DUF1559 domain-containing protein [Candidatus Omnitrophota bacterium]
MKNIQRSIKIIELIIGTGIIIFLGTIFSMQVVSARRAVRMAICVSNLKIIGVAIHAYSQDYDGWLLSPYLSTSKKYWFEILEPYIGNMNPSNVSNLFTCPSDKNHIWKGTNYVYNGHYEEKKLSDFNHPEDSFLIMDGKPDICPFFTKNNYMSCIDFRHKQVGGISFSIVLHVDGNTKYMYSNSNFLDEQFYGY